MFFILQSAAILVGVFAPYPFASYVACVIPVFYIIIMGPGTFKGGSDISIEKLREQLSPRWAHADDLALYMKRYWYALLYAMSATKRQRNCVILALMSFGVAIYDFIHLNTFISGTILVISSVVLYIMSTRINRPLSIFNDPKFRNSLDPLFRNEWRLAATSLVAFSQLFPDSRKHQFLADRILKDDLGSDIVNNWIIRNKLK